MIARSLNEEFATKMCVRYKIPFEGLSLDRKRDLIIEHQARLIAAGDLYQWRSLMLKYSHRKDTFISAFIKGAHPYILKRLWAPESEYRRSSYSRFGGDYQEPPSSTERDITVAPAPKRYKKMNFASPLSETYQNLIQDGVFDDEAAAGVNHPMNGHQRDISRDEDSAEDFILREGRFPAATNTEFQFSTPYNLRKNLKDISDSESDQDQAYNQGFGTELGSQIQEISDRLAAVEMVLNDVSEALTVMAARDKPRNIMKSIANRQRGRYYTKHSGVEAGRRRR